MNPEQEQIGETNPALRGFGLNQWTPRSKDQAWMDQHNVSGKGSDADDADKNAGLTRQSPVGTTSIWITSKGQKGYSVTDHDLHKWVAACG